MDHLEQKPSPCIILLDLMMPIMNGYEFLKKKEGHPKLKPVPTVIMTGDHKSAGQASSLPVIGFLLKPFNVDELLSYVTRYC